MDRECMNSLGSQSSGRKSQRFTVRRHMFWLVSLSRVFAGAGRLFREEKHLFFSESPLELWKRPSHSVKTWWKVLCSVKEPPRWVFDLNRQTIWCYFIEPLGRAFSGTMSIPFAAGTLPWPTLTVGVSLHTEKTQPLHISLDGVHEAEEQEGLVSFLSALLTFSGLGVGGRWNASLSDPWSQTSYRNMSFTNCLVSGNWSCSFTTKCT